MTSLISDAVYYGVIYYDITNHIYHHFATSSLPFTMASFTMMSLITSTPSLRYLLSTIYYGVIYYDITNHIYPITSLPPLYHDITTSLSGTGWFTYYSRSDAPYSKKCYAFDRRNANGTRTPCSSELVMRKIVMERRYPSIFTMASRHRPFFLSLMK